MKAKVLEVIVSSVEEAREAEAGGADRLELVSAIEVGGLTPDLDIVAAVVTCVHIPVRVMLRNEPTMRCNSARELMQLQDQAEALSRLQIGGLVAGFIKDGEVDTVTMRAVFSAAGQCAFTFHRAFDEVADQLSALRQLKELRRVDRVLTVGGQGDWKERFVRLEALGKAAMPDIEILAGAGLCPEVLEDVRRSEALREVHIGRAARIPQTVTGAVRREAVRRVKSAIA